MFATVIELSTLTFLDECLKAFTPRVKCFKSKHFFRCKMVSLERLMVSTLAPLPLKMSWASNRQWVFGTPWGSPKRMTPCLFVVGAMWNWSMGVWQCSHAWDTLCPWLQVSWKGIPWQLTYPLPKVFWRWFSELPKVGYVSSLEGKGKSCVNLILLISWEMMVL